MANLLQSRSDAYVPSLMMSGASIMSDAFDRAVSYFEKELHGNAKQRDWIKGYTSAEEVFEVVEQARTQYADGREKHKKVQKWTSALALRIQHYSGVLDILSQHHPEYVALAWGAIKFLLASRKLINAKGVINHAELLVEISRALTYVAEALPQIKLNLDLYQTEEMQQAVSRTYAYMLLFLQKAAKWYSTTSLSRVVTAVVSPFSLKYQDIVMQIKQCADQVTLIASAGARAETRDLTLKMREHDQILANMLAKLDYLTQLANTQDSRSLQIVQTTTSKSVLTSVNLQGEAIRDIQYSEIVNVLQPQVKPDDVLAKCQAFARRRHSWLSTTSDFSAMLEIIEKWTSAPGSALLTIQARNRAEARAKDLAVHVATLLKSSVAHVFWHLSDKRFHESPIKPVEIVKSIIYQVWRRLGGPGSVPGDLMRIAAFATEHTEKEWLDCLLRLLTGIPECYMVIEAGRISPGVSVDRAWEQGFSDAFQYLVDQAQINGMTLKVLVTRYTGARPHESGTISTARLHAFVSPIAIADPKYSRFGRARQRRRPLSTQLITGHIKK
ncbi:hypothetical protein FOPE_06788 [Fonsecaea pedrosoi]|nr:hypothetical protein FOPE_06788 [Fonsecaea pedrosoi]